MKHSISAIIALLLICIQQNSFGQSKIKDGSITGSASLPDAGAIMELESNNKGFLLPRVALSATNLATPLTAHIAGMTVYNTASGGNGALAVSPGYYYNDGVKWVKLNTEPWYNKSTATAATGNADTIYTMGQVGIGTNNPQRSLHVAGSTDSTAVGTSGFGLISPTMRLEGLNAINNSTHKAADGANSVKPVMVTSAGDLVTGNLNQILAGSTNLTNDLSGGVTISAPANTVVTDTVAERTFTLRQTSLVRIIYSVDITDITLSNGAYITDGRAKNLRNFVRFFAVPGGSPVAVGASGAYGSLIYTSSSSGSSNGVYYNTSAVDVVLSPGTYTIGLMGSVYGGTSGSISATFGLGSAVGINRFSIIAQSL